MAQSPAVTKPNVKQPKHPWVEKDLANLPSDVVTALDQAMALEKTPTGERTDLLWIMAQESEGVVDVRNAHSSARGLFQLTRALYHLNPHGEASFGNAVEECQGGIRYILQTYGSASKAKTFWMTNKWY